MLGWEFPPFFAGGVGIVCYELTKALLNVSGVQVTYVMPYGEHVRETRKGVEILFANHVKSGKFNLKNIHSVLYSYDSPQEYKERITQLLDDEKLDAPNKSIKDIYGPNIIAEVYMYAKRVAKMCADLDFDVIHAHDWTTIPAAFMLKELTGKPVVLHAHITELNKTGGAGGHPKVLEIERYGFQKADRVIAISNMIKDMLINSYQVNPSKIRIVYNGGISDMRKHLSIKNPDEKIVLFAGRVTLQKGPEYFVHAAKRVLEYEPKAKFVFAGTGDMLPRIKQQAYDMGIAENFIFHGFYTREDAERFFSQADVFVMPSVLEPFGIVPLEAIAKGTPTIISKQSGISEILAHTFKVDFWDTEEMANKILGLLRYECLKDEMRNNAFEEFDTFSWDSRADKVLDVYKELQ